MTGGGLPPSVGQILQGDPWFVSSIPNSDHRARMSEAHRPRRTTGRLQRGGVRGAEIRICSHSLRVFSLPDLRILTTSGCCHCQRLEFSLPVAVLTTRASNSHYQWMFSLPELRILTISGCSHYQSVEFSLPDRCCASHTARSDERRDSNGRSDKGV